MMNNNTFNGGIKMKPVFLTITVSVLLVTCGFGSVKAVQKIEDKKIMESLINYSIIKEPEDIDNYLVTNESSTVIKMIVKYNNNGKKAYDEYSEQNQVHRMRERLIRLEENF